MLPPSRRLVALVSVVAVAVAAVPLAAAALDEVVEPATAAAHRPVAEMPERILHPHLARARETIRTREQAAAKARLEAIARWIEGVEEQERREREALWDRMAHCETGGDWQDPGRWAGGLGIYVGTWQAAGGTEFAARPDQATKEQQIVVAERIRARWGIHAWGCADALGL